MTPQQPSQSILIADDYEDSRDLLRLILETEGFRIHEARDGREALAVARVNSIGLALIDLSMPALDGWETLREMRDDERTRRIPCIALTGHAAQEDRQRTLAAGFDGYLSKPFHSKELLELVHGFFPQTDGSSSNDDTNDDDGRQAAAESV